MPIKNVLKALKKLAGKDDSRGNSSPSDDEAEYLEYFCAEDTLLTTDLNITVKGVGKLSFPLTSDTVKNIITVSSKAKFGKGEATLLDMTVRDTQMIPACMLKVGINEESLCNVLERLGSGLNIDQSSRLVPHLFNMLIYGPGQFFKMHRDSEKIKNMVATLVILLPSSHKGGDLIIRHKKSKHIFFGSKKLVKCIAFYSDCKHEIEKVEEGYRVALTYNVVLQSPGVTSNVVLDEGLGRAVQLYFSNENTPKKLVFCLNHSYSEHSLRWYLLKGSDRTYAFSLLVVAKEQGLIPCLALADYIEHCEMTGWLEESVVDTDMELVFWVDEFNFQFKESSIISTNELCYTTETPDLFDPYTEVEEEHTGNEGGYKNKWYRRACVVLWSNKWDFQNGFKNVLHDLKQLTTEKGNEKLVLDEINKAGDKFFKKKFWNDPTVVNLLMDIAAYIKNKEKAIAILTQLANEVMSSSRIGYLQFLEQNYDKEVLLKIFQRWYEIQTDSLIVKKSLKLIQKYLEYDKKENASIFVEILLKRTVKEFLRQNEKYCNLDIFEGTQLNTVRKIFQICANLEHSSLEERIISFILLHPSVYPLYFGTVLLHIQSMTPQNEICKYRNFSILTLKLFDELMSLLAKDDANWSWPFNFPCKCQDCAKLLSFLHSSDETCVIVISEENKRHTNSVLQYLKEQPVSCTNESSKVLMKKLPTLIGTRNKLLRDLVAIEKRLRQWCLTSTQQGTLRSKCTIANNEATSLSKFLDNQQSSGESGNKRKKIK